MQYEGTSRRSAIPKYLLPIEPQVKRTSNDGGVIHAKRRKNMKEEEEEEEDYKVTYMLFKSDKLFKKIVRLKNQNGDFSYKPIKTEARRYLQHLYSVTEYDSVSSLNSSNSSSNKTDYEKKLEKDLNPNRIPKDLLPHTVTYFCVKIKHIRSNTKPGARQIIRMSFIAAISVIDTPKSKIYEVRMCIKSDTKRPEEKEVLSSWGVIKRSYEQKHRNDEKPYYRSKTIFMTVITLNHYKLLYEMGFKLESAYLTFFVMSSSIPHIYEYIEDLEENKNGEDENEQLRILKRRQDSYNESKRQLTEENDKIISNQIFTWVNETYITAMLRNLQLDNSFYTETEEQEQMEFIYGIPSDYKRSKGSVGKLGYDDFAEELHEICAEHFSRNTFEVLLKRVIFGDSKLIGLRSKTTHRIQSFMIFTTKMIESFSMINKVYNPSIPADLDKVFESSYLNSSFGSNNNNNNYLLEFDDEEEEIQANDNNNNEKETDMDTDVFNAMKALQKTRVETRTVEEINEAMLKIVKNKHNLIFPACYNDLEFICTRSGESNRQKGGASRLLRILQYFTKNEFPDTQDARIILKSRPAVREFYINRGFEEMPFSNNLFLSDNLYHNSLKIREE